MGLQYLSAGVVMGKIRIHSDNGEAATVGVAYAYMPRNSLRWINVQSIRITARYHNNDTEITASTVLPVHTRTSHPSLNTHHGWTGCCQPRQSTAPLMFCVLPSSQLIPAASSAKSKAGA